MHIGPNIFTHASSELSQDAFIAWLIEWAADDYVSLDPALHQTSRKLVSSLLDLEGCTIPDKIWSIDVKTQYKNVDILANINCGEYVLLIEDKIYSSEHSNQLRRYKEKIQQLNLASAENTVCVYFKTGDQSNFTEVLNAGFRVFDRTQFLDILTTGADEHIKSDIFTNYTVHLQNIEDAVEAYKTVPISAWDYAQWTGFYKKLKETPRLNGGDYGYVPNQQGGFMAFWWCEGVDTNDGCRLYAQLEHVKDDQEKVIGKLCIKLDTNSLNTEGRRNKRWHWYHQIVPIAKEYNIDLVKPNRFGNGRWMTIALVQGDYRCTQNTDILDIDATVDSLCAINPIIIEAIKRQ